MTLALVLLAGFAALSCWHGGRMAWSDAESLAARWTVAQWRQGRGPLVTAALWTQTRDDLRLALQVTPDNAQLLVDLAYLHASRAQAMGWPRFGSEEEALRQSLLAQAIAYYRAAAAMRPTFPYSWAYLALAKQLKGEQDPEFWVAFDRALQYGRTEAGLQTTLAQLAFAQGSTLSEDRRRLVFNMFTSSQGAARKNLAAWVERNGVAVPGF